MEENQIKKLRTDDHCKSTELEQLLEEKAELECELHSKEKMFEEQVNQLRQEERELKAKREEADYHIQRLLREEERRDGDLKLYEQRKADLERMIIMSLQDLKTD